MLNFYKLNSGYLKFKGAERLDLINRLSTNEVKTLTGFETAKTILTSDKGRIIDLIEIYNFGDFVFASCSFNNSANVIAHLDKYTIMDDFTAVNFSGTYSTLFFTGEKYSEFISEITGTDCNDLKDGKFRVTKFHNGLITINDDPMGGVKLIFPNDDKVYWESKIFSVEIISKYQLSEIDEKDFEIKRIRLGIPAFGKEMSEKTNPLESGLNKYVSFTKGCYIGQEVIARLDAYDKISKHIVGLNIDGVPDNTDEQYKISIDNKECGFTTSIIAEENNKSIGLGFVKTIFLDYNKEYKIKLPKGELNCTINKLPF